MPGRFELATRAVRWRPAEDPPPSLFIAAAASFSRVSREERERERDRGRRLSVIPSRLRPVSEGYNSRSSFSLPSTPRRDSAAARRLFSGLATLRSCFSYKWYQSRGSGSSALSSDSKLSDLRSLSSGHLSGLPPGFCLLLFVLPLKQKSKTGLSPRDFNSTPVPETSDPVLDGSDEEEQHPEAQTQALRDYHLARDRVCRVPKDHSRYGYSYIVSYAFVVASYVEKKEPLCFSEVLKSSNRVL
ncbi:hypothetical protein M9H77_31149 [Catharanthus roseus]|uniref:Uncharacterized protein n=1 Tax=Catharanthus roseus TaxID=4058 RepID=A0ACC0A0J6_CATRO|nr:hypothetical protein M9H77_31149 [Catharanthus roseus]